MIKGFYILPAGVDDGIIPHPRHKTHLPRKTTLIGGDTTLWGRRRVQAKHARIHQAWRASHIACLVDGSYNDEPVNQSAINEINRAVVQ